MVKANTKIANYQSSFSGQSKFQEVSPRQFCATTSACISLLVESIRLAFRGEPDGQI